MAETEIAVIGSGITGSLIAAHLAAAGRHVTILESGPERKLEELYSSTIWSRRLKWSGSPVVSTGQNPVPVPFESGWGSGGAALHHYACWLRLHEADFHRRSRGEGERDWPIDYATLRPHYDRLQRTVGISGDDREEVWRPPSAPYPMPPLPVFRQGELIGEGFARLGMRVAPMPMAINSVEYDGRPPCINDGWCDAGCPTGALANPLVLFGKALAAANVDIRHLATATRILTDARGRRATAVEYVTASGERNLLTAQVVVLAAFTVEAPRLLLNSANDAHPAGLANSSGQVGRNFTTHGAVNIYGMFEEPTYNYLGRTGGSLVNQDRYDDPRRGYGAACTWRMAPSFKFADLGGIANTRPELHGADLHSFMEQAAERLGAIGALIEARPEPGNRVRLSATRDKWGVPIAEVEHTLDSRTTAALGAATEEGLRLMRAAGATEVWAAAPRTEHMMGTLVMGSDRESSVTDSFGRTHDVDNLFVAGPALFPSVGAVNPTFTAAALADRTAEHIAAQWPALKQEEAL